MRVAAAEDALVEDAEQRVEDGGRAEEDLVEEGDLGLGQHARGLGLDDALLQAAQVDGAEDLAGLGEAAEQVLEVAAAERARDAAHGLALGGAGRADDEQVLARHGGEGDQLRQGLALDQAAGRVGEGIAQRARCLGQGFRHGSRVNPSGIRVSRQSRL